MCSANKKGAKLHKLWKCIHKLAVLRGAAVKVSGVINFILKNKQACDEKNLSF